MPIQREKRTLLEKVKIFEEGSEVDDDAGLEGREVYFCEMQQLSYFDIKISRSTTLEDMSLERTDKIHKCFEVFPLLRDKFSGFCIEYCESHILLISDSIEYLRQDPHEQPNLISELYESKQLMVNLILPVSLEFCTDHQLYLFPVLMVLLEDDISCEPGL